MSLRAIALSSLHGKAFPEPFSKVSALQQATASSKRFEQREVSRLTIIAEVLERAENMDWNERPRIHGVTRRQLQQKWSYPAATAALMELCSARTTNSALSALQRPGNSKNAVFAAHNSIFVALGENAQMGGPRQSARGSRSRRSSASMAPSIDARLTHSARSPPIDAGCSTRYVPHRATFTTRNGTS